MYTKAIVARPNFFIGLLRASSAGIRVVGNGLAAKTLTQHVSQSVCSSDNGGGTGNVTSIKHVKGTQNSLSTNAAADKSPQALLLVFPLLMLALEIVRMVAKSRGWFAAKEEGDDLGEQFLRRENSDDDSRDEESADSIDFVMAPMDQYRVANRGSFDTRRKNLATFNANRR